MLAKSPLAGHPGNDAACIIRLEKRSSRPDEAEGRAATCLSHLQRAVRGLDLVGVLRVDEGV